ncbi:hypothetical protein GH714_033677 [Hevea brasiliensis]|uniref:Uncharacterized protein n=1 Tax=Hevea brasiliensis TaxID=3981 RepID=A0A6A6NE69_HEVBR|nr:hypothetical protein GH714_033677 [Hevea brasiliensis]
MQFASVELDVHSSQNNLSVVKNLKSNASSSKLKATDELRLAEEISEDFTAPHAAMKEEETDMHKEAGEVLWQDSIPSNVTRDQSSNILALGKFLKEHGIMLIRMNEKAWHSNLHVQFAVVWLQFNSCLDF